jgi:[acyl-carrier-protein] S-malonyltransferase
MNILLLFAGQGYNGSDLFDLFHSHKPSVDLLKQLSTAAEFDLIQSANQINNLHYTQSLIGAYQFIAFKAMAPLLSSHQLNCAGYSLGEVSAFLASVDASPDQVMETLKFRTKLMASILDQSCENEFDLLAIRGQFKLKKLQGICQQYDCHIAIINSEAQFIIGGKVSSLEQLTERLRNEGLEKATFLSIHLPSHTSFYAGKSGELHQYLTSTFKQKSLAYPVINPLKLSKIYKIEEEIILLDEELSHCLEWFKLCQLILEYHYDLIIDLGPGRSLTQFLADSMQNIMTLADYKSIQGFMAQLEQRLLTSFSTFF